MILGKDFIPICKLQMCRLISIQLNLVENYIQRAEQLFLEYKVEKKVEDLFQSWSDLTKKDRLDKLNYIDK